MRHFKMLSSVAAVVLALTGAFATQAAKESGTLSGAVPGYIKNGTKCANYVRDCNNQSGALCTDPISSVPLWGMTSGGNCPTQLFHKP